MQCVYILSIDMTKISTLTKYNDIFINEGPKCKFLIRLSNNLE